MLKLRRSQWGDNNGPIRGAQELKVSPRCSRTRAHSKKVTGCFRRWCQRTRSRGCEPQAVAPRVGHTLAIWCDHPAKPWAPCTLEGPVAPSLGCSQTHWGCKKGLQGPRAGEQPAGPPLACREASVPANPTRAKPLFFSHTKPPGLAASPGSGPSPSRGALSLQAAFPTRDPQEWGRAKRTGGPLSQLRLTLKGCP